MSYRPIVPPPHRILSRHALDTTTALSNIQNYLFRSTTEACLHPDSTLTPSGAQFGSHGGSQGGLVLHQLRRIEAGLRGERIDKPLQDEDDLNELPEGDDSAFPSHDYTKPNPGPGPTGEVEARHGYGSAIEESDDDTRVDGQVVKTTMGEVANHPVVPLVPKNVAATATEEGGGADDEEERRRRKKDRKEKRKREREEARKSGEGEKGEKDERHEKKKKKHKHRDKDRKEREGT